MKTSPLILLGLTALTGVAVAAPQTFDFKDPKGVNNAVFKLDAPLEAIQGSANGISGLVVFDPENAASTRGKLVVSAASLHVPNRIIPRVWTHRNRWSNWVACRQSPCAGRGRILSLGAAWVSSLSRLV